MPSRSPTRCCRRYRSRPRRQRSRRPWSTSRWRPWALGVGHVRGRGYVDETEAAWELVEGAIAPFRSDLERRGTLGYFDAATKLVVGIVAGLYRVREPDMGTVVAYAGEETTAELTGGVVELAERLGVTIPDDAAAAHWPAWIDLG